MIVCWERQLRMAAERILRFDGTLATYGYELRRLHCCALCYQRAPCYATVTRLVMHGGCWHLQMRHQISLSPGLSSLSNPACPHAPWLRPCPAAARLCRGACVLMWTPWTTASEDTSRTHVSER